MKDLKKKYDVLKELGKYEGYLKALSILHDEMAKYSVDSPEFKALDNVRKQLDELAKPFAEFLIKSIREVLYG